MENLFDILDGFGVPRDKIESLQILCLPENIYHVTAVEELLDSGDSATLSKELKAKGVKCGNSSDLGLEPRVRLRKGLDIWLGVVFVIEYIALPFLISAIANLATSRMLDLDSKIYLNLRIRNEKKVTAIDYEGDPDTLKRILDALSK